VKISVTVKPNSRQNKVEKSESGYLIWTQASPTENKANKAVVELLADYLNVPKSRITIIAGLKSKRKIIDLKH
jgi:uncharacterized protein YggU (UPF0235/DUF167 family)